MKKPLLSKFLISQYLRTSIYVLYFLVPYNAVSQSENFNCNTISNLACGQTISSTTVGGGNGFNKLNYTCHTTNNPFDAEDKVYKINPTFTGSHEIILSGLSKDLDIFLFSGTCAGGACIGKGTLSGNSIEKIIINLIAGSSYYVVVDGYNVLQVGNFNLSLHCPAPLICANGITDLTCGMVDTFTTVGRPSQYVKSNFTSCMTLNNSTFSAGDKVFKYKHTAASPDAVFSIWGYAKDLDVFVFNSCYTSANCIKAAKNKQEKHEYIDFTGLPYGDYYIVVDGYDASQVSSFLVSINCQVICKQTSISTPLLCNDVVNGTTVDGIYTFSKYSCDLSYEFTGPEKYYSFKAPSQDTFIIDLFGFSNDLELFITQPLNCNANPICKASSLNTSGYPEKVKIFLQKDEMIFIVVDGSLGDCGPFKLKITCPVINRCADSEVISCGLRYNGSTLNSGNEFSKPDYAQCHQTSLTYNGNDKVYKYTHTSSNKNAEVVLWGFTTDLDLFLLTSCGAPASCIDCSANTNKKYEVIDFSNKPYGDYYIVVDGASSSQNGNYSIAVSCQYDCTDYQPETIACNTAVQGNTSSGMNRFCKYSCSNESQFTGNEKMYRFKATQAGEHTIDLTGFSNDLELFVVDDLLCKYSPICKAKSINHPDLDEQIKITLQLNETIDIVVDGSLGANGPFTLKITCPVINRCADSEVISCGLRYNGSTLNSGNEFSKPDYAQCHQTSLTYNGNDKVYKYNHNSTNKNAQVVLWGYTTDLNLFLLNSCGATASCVDCSATSKKYEAIDFSNKPYGDYYIVVDGSSSSQNGNYSISISCQYDCSDSQVENIACNTPIQGNTNGGKNRFSKYSCFNESHCTGNEKVYRFKAAQSGEHIINLSGFSNDLELFVVEDYSCKYNLECKSKSTNLPNQDEQIKIYLQQNETIDIVVDGALGSNGSFTLKVNCPIVNPIEFDASNNICDLKDKTIQIPVKVKNFKNVTSFSMTVKSENINIVQIKSISSSTLSVVSHFVNEVNKTITITFLGATPATLVDGATAFIIEAVLVGNAGQSASIQIVDSPTMIKAVVTENNQNSLYPVETKNGGVCVLTPPPPTQLKFDIDDAVCDINGNMIQIPVRVVAFKNIRSFSMTVTVDNTSILEINSITSPLSGLTYFESTPKKTFTLQWLSNVGVTLADGSIVYYINAKLVGNLNQSANLSIIATPTNIQAVAFENNQNLSVPVEVMGGSACINSLGVVDCTGKVIDRKNASIRSAQVKLRGSDSINVLTPSNGTYAFNNLVASGNYNISVMKNTDPRNGIDLLDLALLQDHIITRTILTDPYKLLAADLNRDGSIDILDLAELQDLIITRINSFTNNTSWIFIPTDETLTAAKVFAKTYRTTRVLLAPPTDQANLDFYGVKIGDIDQSANTQTLIHQEEKLIPAIEQRSVGNLSMRLPSMNVKKDQTIYVPLVLEKFSDVRVFQFMVSWDHTKLEYIKTESFNKQLAGFNESNMVYNPENLGVINSLWLSADNNSLPDNAQLFVMVFKVKANMGDVFSIGLNEVKAMEVGSLINPVKITNSKITVSDVSTRFKGVDQDLLIKTFPNPTADRIQLTAESSFEVLELIDSKGSVHPLHLASKSSYTIDLQSYPSGIYFIKAKQDHKISVHKFVLSK